MIDQAALRDHWTLVPHLIREEVDAYLAGTADPSKDGLPTRCPPWTVLDVTKHLAATVSRFNRLLRQSRARDLSPPFAPEGLSDENLRAVAAFQGDPLERFRVEVGDFLVAAVDPDELIAHQLGPISVGLQMRFALNEIAIHHDDVAAAQGDRYRPSPGVIDALVPVWMEVLGPLPGVGDPWDEILKASGR
jgi:uncharacterized protein (TIGR03083 family)